MVNVRDLNPPDVIALLENLADKTKIPARAVFANGVRFDSATEYRRFCYLESLEMAGAISQLKHHPKFTLVPAYRTPLGTTHRAITFKADAQYLQEGQVVVEDVKGWRRDKRSGKIKPEESRDFRMRVKMLQYGRRDILFRVVYEYAGEWHTMEY